VYSPAFEHEKTMLHHMDFNHRKRRAGLVRHQVHCTVECHVIRQQMPDSNRLISFQRLGGNGRCPAGESGRRTHTVEGYVAFLDDRKFAFIDGSDGMLELQRNVSVNGISKSIRLSREIGSKFAVDGINKATARRWKLEMASPVVK